jgi:predicted alpha-1,2-mannosidase
LSAESLIAQNHTANAYRKTPVASRHCWRFPLAALPLFLLAAVAPAADTSPASTPYDAVDPFIGTGGEGHTYPGAVAPFGMVQLSPDTDTTCVIRACYSHAAGYRYEDPTIQGFSHTHFSGAGHSDLGDILVMPAVGDDAAVALEPGDAKVPGTGYRSRFDHASEVAHPGYYAVTLSDAQVRAELTAGTRIGVHRYTFPSDKPAHLVLDLRTSLYTYPGKILWSSVSVTPDGLVTGMRETRGWAPARKLWFAMRFSAPLTGHAFRSTESDVAYKGFQGPGRGDDGVAMLAGRALVARLDFGTLAAPLEVKVALSSVDEAGALANLAAEPGDFDAVRARTHAAWDQALGAVSLSAAPAMRRTLYTALYHSLLAPSVAGDVDGRYRGPDNEVHKADGFTFRSTFSLWDTFRAEHPLLTLLQPDRTNADIVNSLLASQHDSPFGILPVWQYQGRETWTMIGYHAVPVIADAYLKGVRGFDANKALDAMVASASYAPYGGLGDYMKLGYVPIDREPEAASKTVEYAYDDWTIARMARALGRLDIAATFDKRAQYWRNSFDAKTGWLRARKADGSRRDRLRERLYRGECLAIFMVRPAGPGRAGAPARRRRGDGKEARRDVRFRQFEGRLQPCRGHCRADRPVYPWQRAEPPRRLSLQLCRGALAHAGAPQADRRQPVQTDPRWPRR